MTTRIFGSGIKRREDPRLITGRATYSDDIRLPGMLHMVVVRSELAHARLVKVDTSRAAALPGVVAVFTGHDVAMNTPCAWLIPDSGLKVPPHPVLATDRVRYVGDGIAIVLAETRYLAEDAAGAIHVEYEELPAVVNPEEATRDGAPQLFDDVPHNIAFRWIMNPNPEGLKQAFDSADLVIKERIVQQRLLPTAMEPRACAAQWNAGTQELTIWVTSQNPHIHRFILSGMTGVPEHKLRIIAPEVGGGFGSKIPVYPDEALAGWAAMQLNRPVRWSETRSENYITTIHGRDHVEYVEMALKNDGTVLALKGTVYAGMGAYISTAGPGIPTILHGLMYSGAYNIAHVYCESIGALTNTTPTDAYRGAGRPEATFLVERLMEKAANALNMDPVAFRRKNLLPKFENHTVATGLIYDSGDYEPALQKALAAVDYDSFRREQAAAREQGRYLGIGVTTYTEICGLGPSQVAGAIGFQGGLWESAIIRVSPAGKVQALMGISPHGQGEETTFAQLISEELGFPVEDIEIVHGDTNMTPMGWGTYGSRTTPVAGAALVKAARKMKEKAKAMAAHLLEAAVEDIDYDDGKFFVKGSPDKFKSIQEITLMATLAWSLPPGMDPGMEESQFYDPPNFVYPFGTHIAIVEVDPQTGQVTLKRYVAVDDCGPQINPLIVSGQIHGGIVQGVAQALFEGVVYDDHGQLLTGSMMDYTLPRADMFPTFELDHTVTPSPHHPIGIKGVGETGTIASTPTVYNAVMDALRPFNLDDIPMPLTPARVWAAIHGHSNGH
ncbi:MAG: molybdopterin-dependent oxidoreductase [Anaerolineae bacterium]|nr:molybdopterin-dependent oxidoreductase [Anaerolineae bacterium]